MVKTPLGRKIVVLILIFILLGAVGYNLYLYSMRDTAPDRSEWAYEMIQATQLNSQGYYGKDITVAIIDTGIDLTHPELKRFKNDKNSYIWLDLVNGRSEPYDDNGHGTAMAGLIAGKSYGVAPRVDLIIIKTISSEGTGSVDDISDAIRYAITNGADIISLSLGGGRFPIIGTDAERAAQDAISVGIYVVAAAGNDGDDDNGDVDSPSNVELVISTGAVDKAGIIGSFSSIGNNDGRSRLSFDDRVDPNKKPEVVAPGVDINVPMNKGRYARTSGTSVSTAFVSGIIALTLEANMDYKRHNNNEEESIREFKGHLMDTAVPAAGQPGSGHDDHYGYGIIQGAALSNSL